MQLVSFVIFKLKIVATGYEGDAKNHLTNITELEKKVIKEKESVSRFENNLKLKDFEYSELQQIERVLNEIDKYVNNLEIENTENQLIELINKFRHLKPLSENIDILKRSCDECEMLIEKNERELKK